MKKKSNYYIDYDKHGNILGSGSGQDYDENDIHSGVPFQRVHYLVLPSSTSPRQTKSQRASYILTRLAVDTV